jgi:hypothetical protein
MVGIVFSDGCAGKSYSDRFLGIYGSIAIGTLLLVMAFAVRYALFGTVKIQRSELRFELMSIDRQNIG